MRDECNTHPVMGMAATAQVIPVQLRPCSSRNVPTVQARISPALQGWALQP